MTAPPLLFDTKAIGGNRQRARDPGLFLHRAARDVVEDRLSLINRTFTNITVVTPFPQIWADFADGATMIADTDTLDLQPESQGLIVHAMCLHWANDPVGQMIQSRRALRPDGLFLAVLLGGTTLGELRDVLRDAEATVSGGLAPRVSPTGDIRDLGALLQRAGFALPVADSETLTAEYRNLTHLAHDLRDMGETNALAARPRGFSRRAMFQQADETYKSRYGLRNGRIPATFEMISLTGWAPSQDQPQPLRPGSAAARLADVLGTDEFQLPD